MFRRGGRRIGDFGCGIALVDSVPGRSDAGNGQSLIGNGFRLHRADRLCAGQRRAGAAIASPRVEARHR